MRIPSQHVSSPLSLPHTVRHNNREITIYVLVSVTVTVTVTGALVVRECETKAPFFAMVKEMIVLTNEKKGFIFYFDNYPTLSSLSMEQRGLLFSALTVYADRVWRDTSVSMEEVLDGFPQLSQEARVACGLMGSAIYRDTLTWLNRREAFRHRKGPPSPAAPRRDSVPARYQEDMDRIKRLMGEE